MKYQPRTYRNYVGNDRRISFRVRVAETDLHIQADRNLEDRARGLVLKYRWEIEQYIRSYPDFAVTLEPWKSRRPAPAIIRDMIEAGQSAGVGPMAAVAGVISEYVGRDLLELSEEVVVENGGDVFIKTSNPAIIGIYAGQSPFSLRVGLKIQPEIHPVAVCTSSGTVGHSLSLGSADAVCVVSDACHFADASATSVANHVRSRDDIPSAVEFGKRLSHVRGIVVIRNEQIGMWGDLELVPLTGKNG